tara:strand:+ start:1158 stop:1334 length:177 start_codon:yes stop_codon:yes gene_type:complete
VPSKVVVFQVVPVKEWAVLVILRLWIKERIKLNEEKQHTWIGAKVVRIPKPLQNLRCK